MLVVPENVVPLHTQTRNNDGAIAQLVEQRTENPCVPGSIPGGTTFFTHTLLHTLMKRVIRANGSFFLFVPIRRPFNPNRSLIFLNCSLYKYI